MAASHRGTSRRAKNSEAAGTTITARCSSTGRQPGTSTCTRKTPTALPHAGARTGMRIRAAGSIPMPISSTSPASVTTAAAPPASRHAPAGPCTSASKTVSFSATRSAAAARGAAWRRARTRRSTSTTDATWHSIASCASRAWRRALHPPCA